MRRELGGEIAKLIKENDDLEAAADRHEREMLELRAEYDRLAEENRDLERLVAQLRSERVRASQDVSTADDLGHVALARDVTTFLTQDLPALIRPLLRSADLRGAERGRHQAELTERACRILFSGRPVEIGELLDGLTDSGTDHEAYESLVDPAENVCRIANEIRQRATELDKPNGFFFDCPGDLIDSAVQKQWGGCDEQARISFVVTPGYRANGKTYRLQEVFTQV